MINTQPVNNNFLSPLGYKLSIDKMPTFNYFVQAVKVPAARLPPAVQATPFSAMPFPGDHIQYTPLVVTFKLDEALLCYTEIYGWMEALGFPQSFDQYRTGTQSATFAGKLETVSDASLIVLSSAMNPIFVYKFKNLYPSAIGAFNFDTREGDVNYITCDVEFTYGYFTVSRDPQDFGA